ncbi:hypothetical protein C8F04DRAFT_1397752 [Mycena alexandri]|uniref:F-box domain-containing protein n=1 Tax=Mycena alexandri TaxID=1745969 RepID=A0AAD6SNC4_9AGAR|nr:hypothetical protein C8F04DRAFT_1397752 [Mycena alexandri]
MPLNDEREKNAKSAHRPSERNTLAADRAHIAIIKAKIIELQRSLFSMIEEMGLLQERINGYTYPVLTLPNEIVSEIFVHFLPIYPDPPPIIGRSSPNVLGQICRKWRDIAFSTPALWRGIALSLENGKRLDQKLRLLETWLQRSGSCLLSINMDLGCTIGPVAMGPFLASIAAHSARWEHLLLLSDLPFPSIAAPFPFLRTLYMCSEQPVEHSIGPFISALHAAPLLLSVGILPWRHSYISFYPWSQLTMFTAQMILPQHCVEVLTHALNLVYCNFHVTPQYYEPFSELGLTHHYIETFILEGSFSPNLPWTFLDLFTLPALQKFQVAENLLQGTSIHLLRSLISRSRCDIKELYLTRSRRVEAYRIGLPMVGSIVDGQLSVNPFFVSGDEEPEAAEYSNAHFEDAESSTSTASADEEDNEQRSSEESD